MEKRHKAGHYERSSRHSHKRIVPNTRNQNINYDQQRESRRNFFRFVGQGAAFIVAVASGLSADSARPSKQDFANSQVNELTGIDLASWKSSFDLNLEEFVYNPQASGQYLITLGQIHHGPEKSKWGKYEDEYLQSQGRIEKVLTHFSQIKPLPVFIEGVTDQNIDDIYRIRDIKKKVDAALFDLPTIVQMSTEFVKDIFKYISADDLKLPRDKQRFYELHACALYIYEQYINKAYEFLLKNPNIEIPEQVESMINETREDKNSSSYEYLLSTLSAEARIIQSTSSFWGAPDIRSTLSAPYRLFIDGVIEILPSESHELNQKAGDTTEQALTASQAVLADPTNGKLVEAYHRAVEENEAANHKRNQMVVEIVTSTPTEGQFKFVIFGDRHVWSNYVTEHNESYPTSQTGLIGFDK